MQVYEYYDDYEHLWDKNEKKRPKVQYILLSDNPIIICYVGDINYICPLNEMTHNRAWKHSEIDIINSIKCINNGLKSYRTTIPKLQAIIEDTLLNKTKLDLKHNIKKPGYSSSGGDSSYTISLNYGDSYSEKYIEEMKKKIHILEETHLCLDKLMKEQLNIKTI